MSNYSARLYEDWKSRLNEFQMRKQRQSSTLSHLGSQGYSMNKVPNSYRPPGPSSVFRKAGSDSNLMAFRPAGNGQDWSPQSGKNKSAGKLYRPRKPPSIRTKGGPITNILL